MPGKHLFALSFSHSRFPHVLVTWQLYLLSGLGAALKKTFQNLGKGSENRRKRDGLPPATSSSKLPGSSPRSSDASFVRQGSGGSTDLAKSAEPDNESVGSNSSENPPRKQSAGESWKITASYVVSYFSFISYIGGGNSSLCFSFGRSLISVFYFHLIPCEKMKLDIFIYSFSNLHGSVGLKMDRPLNNNVIDKYRSQKLY